MEEEEIQRSAPEFDLETGDLCKNHVFVSILHPTNLQRAILMHMLPIGDIDTNHNTYRKNRKNNNPSCTYSHSIES